MTCVRVTREHHPLQDHSLEVLGQMHCRGRLELLLVLPDGSKSLVPAAWTDYAADSQPGAGIGTVACGVLAAPENLLAVRVVVSALSRERSATRSRLHGSSRPRRTTVQPVQLSLLPEQLPPPPDQLFGQLPRAQLQEALT